ncbi:hypothetical protein VTI74DRAFT_3467 [Chaetomium olivicolor]
MLGSQLIQSVVEEWSRLQESYLVIRQTVAALRLSRWQLMRLLAAQIWRDMTPFAAIILVALSVSVAWSVSRIFRFFARSPLDDLGMPLVGGSWGGKLDFRQMMEDNAKQHPDRPYRLRAFGIEYVVFPSKFFNEVKRIPSKQASLLEFARHAFHGSWSGIGQHSEEMIDTVAADISRGIPSLVRARQQDCAAACDAVLGDCPDWKEVTLYPAMQEIVASTNASALVGRNLGTNKKWVSNVERLPLLVAVPAVILSAVPVWLQPLFKPLFFAPVRYSRFVLARLLAPVLKEDIREYESSTDKKALAGPKAKGKMPVTSWLMGRYPASYKKNLLGHLTNDCLGISFESTSTTSGTLFYIMVELAADPALADTVRQELREVAPEGRLPSTQLNELKVMDSVMRESARVNPFSHIVLSRKLLQPLQLSTGPLLPAGTIICVDAHHINFSSALWGPNPENFDGLRHYRERQKPGKENRFKFANLGSDAPGWGDGPQACPGRMFADNTLKIIITHLLTHYDVKLIPGKGKPKKGTLPNGSMYPDTGAKVLFRSRRGGLGVRGEE